MQANQLIEKVALVTGAARRIGAEIAKTLHAQGMNIIVHYHHSAEEALALCQQLNQQRPHSAVAIPMDLQQAKSEATLVTQAAQVWGRLDVLVNNASRFYRTIFGKATTSAWEDLIHCNLKVPFFLAQSAAPWLKQTQGVIINIIDIHAYSPLRDYSIYCISKSGLVMLTQSLAKELGPDIRVNGVAPGAILWPEGENTLSAAEKKKIISQAALQRVGGAQPIAKAVLFFVKDADYITGQVLNVDGGRL